MTLHTKKYPNPRNYGNIVLKLGHAGFISSTVRPQRFPRRLVGVEVVELGIQSLSFGGFVLDVLAKRSHNRKGMTIS